MDYTLISICGDLERLLGEAPRAVDSFHPGHWEFMLGLEEQARSVLAGGDIDGAVDFLSNVAFLKQPHRVDRQAICQQLRTFPNEIYSAVEALRRVSDLDYRAMDALSNVPWFGRNGGRAFNSAVMRLVRPEAFGIIDWRNLAVIMGAPGFEGFINPVMHLSEFTCDEVLELKGHLKLTQRIYEQYNDALRILAHRHGKKTAEIDLSLWAYSIGRQPFRSWDVPQVRSVFVLKDSDRDLLRTDHGLVAKRMVQEYLGTLKDRGLLLQQRVVQELQAVFLLVRDECELFGRNKRGKLRDKIRQVVNALDEAIAKPNEYRLLAKWSKWYGMVDPASPNWIGISLPTDMVLEGYLVFEDFLSVKEYFETFYDPETLEGRTIVD